MATLAVRWLGRVPYAEALQLQEALVAARRRCDVPDTLLLLEHDPVITLGRSSDPAHVLAGPEALRARGIEIHACGRGGDVTWHGPGQLVGYPIVGLRGEERDAHRYLRTLERALAATAAAYGVRGKAVEGLTGIWVGERKLAAIGVRLCAGWITCHGFALNVSGDLSGFDLIVPCGIRGRGVTSLERETGRTVPLAEVAHRAAAGTAEALGLSPAFQASAA